MKKRLIFLGATALLGLCRFNAQAQQYDPPCVVEQWSNASTYNKVIDIDFSDSDMPDTWKGKTGTDCPSYSTGGYYNGILEVPIYENGQTSEHTYPLLFHNSTFANKNSYNGFAAATAAFARQFYDGQNATQKNDWTQPGHTVYLEDSITYTAGKPTHGIAGYAHLCRDGATTDSAGNKVSMHGWLEIDHIPYVERVQWSWSSSSWGRGVKCDYKIGDGEWKPLVWMGSNKQKNGYTVYSDQGYFMENIIDAHDVSLRWRIWDGDPGTTTFQTDADGNPAFNTAIDPYGQQQPVKIHKIQIFGEPISAAQAEYARENPVSDVGDITYDDPDDDESNNDQDGDTACTFSTVAQDGSGDFTSVQEAIDAVAEGTRGIIFIRNGVYDENIYAGTSVDKNKYISLIGESRDGTILTSSIDRGEKNPDNNYLDCAALNVFVKKFYAENLTIRNTSGNVGQAEALYTAGDAHIFNNCTLSGYQDTYKSNSGSRGYFYNCLIEGATDFIYDSGLEWFESCTINCVPGGGYITAAADASLKMTKVLYPSLSNETFYAGLFFNNCNITADAGVADGSYYLGRPWKEQCGTVFMNCTLGNHIKSVGWAAWNGAENSASYYEYKNIDPDGNPVNTSGRASWSHHATETEREAYFNTKFLFSEQNSEEIFDPEALFSAINKPANPSLSGHTISWEASGEAAGYMILRDGKFVTFTTSNTYNIDDETSTWSVKSVSKRGITSQAVECKAQLTAFPTAEGFGKYASGGRGGKVVTVTNLNDDGEGSLRWAFQQYKNDPLTIVFAVSGEIILKSEMKVNRKNWTLAGQTAPGDGIVITHNKVNFGSSENFIVRNIRFRIGQKDVNGNIIAENACGAENCTNFIFDHCTFGWSVEENMNVFDSHFHTVQYCIIHEGLYNAGHSKGARGYGCQWGGSPATYHHNLLAHNNSRSCRFNGARGEDYVVYIEYFNNVNYNWGSRLGCYGGENTANITEYNGLNAAHECNFVNNYYRPGKNTTSQTFVAPSYKRDGATSWGPSQWYISGNIMHGNSSVTSNNWNGVSPDENSYTKAQLRVDSLIIPKLNYYKWTLPMRYGEYDFDTYAYAAGDYETAQEAYETVLAQAGTINRDAVERRIVEEVRSGTTTNNSGSKGNGIIDSENDAEGFFSYSIDYVVPADSDGDGMPDEWEKAHGLNPNVADNNYVNADGYTALEVYLNSLMGEVMDDQFTSAIPQTTTEKFPVWYSDGILHTGNCTGNRITIYNTAGQIIREMIADKEAVQIDNLPTGIFFVKAQNPDTATPTVIKIIR